MAIIRRDLLAAGEISSWAEIAAWGLLTFGFWWSRDLDLRFNAMVGRLYQRRVISAETSEVGALLSTIAARARTNARIGAVVFPLAIIFAYVCVYFSRERTGDHFWLKIALEIAAGALVGGIGGRVVTYGFLGQWLRQRNLPIQVKLGHPDGTGGLKVVGDFFLYQATLVLLPAIFFAFWWAIAPAWPVDVSVGPFDFLEWRNLFALFFLILIGIETLAFVAPMIFFHRKMFESRQLFDREADEIGEAILQIDEELAEPTDGESIEKLAIRRQQLESRFQQLDAAPIWPVDSRIRHRFTWGNTALFALPMLTKLPFMPRLIEDTLNNLLGIQ